MKPTNAALAQPCNPETGGGTQLDDKTFVAVIPSYDGMTDFERAAVDAGHRPVRLVFASAEQAARAVASSDPLAPKVALAADQLADALAASLVRVGARMAAKVSAARSTHGEAAHDDSPRPVPEGERLSDDAYIDQRSGLVDKVMYLRLARRKAFPSQKIGKRIVARWGDVKAVMTPPAPPPAVKQDNASAVDELDALRSSMGLLPKSRNGG